MTLLGSEEHSKVNGIVPRHFRQFLPRLRDWIIAFLWTNKSGNNSLHFSFFEGENRIQTSDFRGSYELSLTATLTGGNGQDAWQHAQLFRQPMNSEEFSLSIIIKYL